MKSVGFMTDGKTWGGLGEIMSTQQFHVPSLLPPWPCHESQVKSLSVLKMLLIKLLKGSSNECRQRGPCYNFHANFVHVCLGGCELDSWWTGGHMKTSALSQWEALILQVTTEVLKPTWRSEPFQEGKSSPRVSQQKG